MTVKPLRIVFSGGGTGGHLFPAIALAKTFIREVPGTQILFVTSGNPLENRLISENGFLQKQISIKGLKGMGIGRQVEALLLIPRAILDSLKILLKFQPQVVFGMGGYSSGPVIIAGRLLKLKIALCEQNILPGLTNRFLSHFAHRIFVSFPETFSHLKPAKVKVLGNPVRHGILKVAEHKSAKHFEKPSHLFCVVILGGSQGAHPINMAVLEALACLNNTERFHFIHQTGADDEATVLNGYRKLGISADVQAFFKNMADLYRQADLIVCRAGATTIAEICAVGIPAVYIPFPFAADNHQVLNAQRMIAGNAARMILQKDLSGKVLAETLESLIDEPETLSLMAKNARQRGKPNVSFQIVAECRRLVFNH
jgi:UDP-N-acetylglucosamine--N-acetylmuramyl-(pentapeptide) pyrophosphoryl-undecaprenol N-acetylglucosamine transferase